jgi:hypothetical protein
MRTAKEVIDQAIAENRLPEYMLYGFACLFVLVGMTLIGFALYEKSSINAIAGAALNGLAWPAYNGTQRIRAENLMLRMLEVPLMKAKTADEAAKMLTQSFGSHFKGSASNKVVKE